MGRQEADRIARAISLISTARMQCTTQAAERLSTSSPSIWLLGRTIAALKRMHGAAQDHTRCYLHRCTLYCPPSPTTESTSKRPSHHQPTCLSLSSPLRVRHDHRLSQRGTPFMAGTSLTRSFTTNRPEMVLHSTRPGVRHHHHLICACTQHDY